MGCSPSHVSREGDVELNDNDDLKAPTKNGDLKQRSVNSVKFEEHDLVWSAGKQYMVKHPSTPEEVNRTIRTLTPTKTKFMQEVRAH